MMDWAAAALIVGAFGGLAGLAALYTAVANARISARKADIEILQIALNNMREENQHLQAEIEKLRRENGELRNRLNDLHDENEQLRKKLGMTDFRRPIRKGLAIDDGD